MLVFDKAYLREGIVFSFLIYIAPLRAVATRFKPKVIGHFHADFKEIVCRDVEIVVEGSLSCGAIAQIAINCYELHWSGSELKC